MRQSIQTWRQWAHRIKLQVYTLAVALRSPQVPWYAKALGGLVVAYAFSPIDLIPDFIPVLGYLDDLVLIPLGIVLVRKLVSPSVWQHCSADAQRLMQQPKPHSLLGLALVSMVWLAVLVGGIWLWTH